MNSTTSKAGGWKISNNYLHAGKFLNKRIAPVASAACQAVGKVITVSTDESVESFLVDG
jgi:hypothetical protein